jgi:N-acetylmuramoyl-L-alanine amidase
MIKSWRLENIGGSVRLRLSFNSKGQIYRRFLLPPADGISVYRYVVDIIPSGSDPENSAVPEVTPVYAANVTPKTTQAAFPKRAKKVVVIDAGHGGRDPGASGENTKEKDITLASALALKAVLEKTGRYKVIMTRETDTYVDLAARVRIARNADADLFISLHADSGAENATVRGASIYTLSDSGTERAAKKAMIRGDWSLGDVPQDKIVNRILIDLSQRATKNRSSIFAQLVIDNIADSTPVMKSGLRQAGFMVLLAPDVPAVLLEMGFLSNGDDEAMLNDSKHRTVMMAQVAKGIDQYFSSEVRYASFAGIE